MHEKNGKGNQEVQKKNRIIRTNYLSKINKIWQEIFDCLKGKKKLP